MMMTETRSEHEDRRPGLCEWKKGPSSCWREARVPAPWEEDATPRFCEEHALAFRLDDEAFGYLAGLEGFHEWVRVHAETDRGPLLRDLAYDKRDDLERLYLDARIRATAARLFADRGPEEEGADLETEEKVQRRLALDEALVDARTLLEDLPAEALPSGFDRWETCAALLAVHEEREPDEGGGS